MSNEECLRIFEQGLALKVQDQLAILDEDIHALKRRQAAKGLLKSGATIREVAGLCKKILESRVKYIFETLRSLPFKYSSGLDSKISEISLKYFSADLVELRARLEDIIRLATGEHAKDRILGEIAEANETEVKRFKNYLDQFLLTLTARDDKTGNFAKWAGGKDVTLAILFTDMVGSTNLGLQLGDEQMEEVRQEHFSQCRRLLDGHKGRDIKTIGDSLMAAFRAVGEALDFAMELQDNPGHAQIKIRAGIHIGQLQVVGDDVFGETVNFTARVVDAIEGSEIWLSDRAKQDIDGLRANRHSHLKWEQREGIALKGFQGKYTLWRLASISK